MRQPTLTSLLTWSIFSGAAVTATATSAQQQPPNESQRNTTYNSVSSIYTKLPKPFSNPATYELDLIFPLGTSSREQLTFLPSYTFPAIFAFQNTDFPHSFRPEAKPDHAGMRYLTYNLSSLIDLTIPGKYTLSWSFHAHNCSSTSSSSWGTSPYDNTWVMDYYFPHQPFQNLPTSTFDERKLRYYGTKQLNFTITTTTNSDAARNPMSTNSWIQDKNLPCPYDNVILRIAGQKQMATKDPMHNPFPGEGYTNQWMEDTSSKNMTEGDWEGFNRWCTYLARPEMGVFSVEEEKMREVDEELWIGRPCNGVLDKEMAGRVMRGFLGWMSLEEAVGGEVKGEEESEA
ncbi:hypothetical protein B0T20DRAFT_500350 [Sordaria brevicollis]|uniref:Uncharacterized protein n=1 Tax=Sordaria brevicollis TaxID=83679 RepID=A0AAE0PC49_SORBR|nr:hypothetical protein B0T20DRAFT_500350 [Sordaria brevicollis]